jgi:hypothetical protein
MGIVTAAENRAESREIYFPPNELGMVHYSYASPDRKSVLAVEMNQTHAFSQPCRLLPFDQVSFGAEGELIFRSLEEKTNWLVRIQKDGTGRERVTTAPILDKGAVSPGGAWVIAFSPGSGNEASRADRALYAVPSDGRALRRICSSLCSAAWSSDGKFFYVSIAVSASATSPGRTIVIPVPAGKSLPDLPAAGIDSTAGGSELPDAQVIAHGAISPGPDPSTYVFTRTDQQRNLFRIPLH